MAKTDFKSVGEYIATHPEDVQAVLQRVRSTIRKAVPSAEEVISYQIPAYKLPGSWRRSRTSRSPNAPWRSWQRRRSR